MDFQDTVPLWPEEEPRHFLPRKSGASWLIAFLLGLLALVLGLASWSALSGAAAQRSSYGVMVLPLLTLACAMGIGYAVHRAASRRPVLGITGQGIESPQLAEPVAWRALDDAVLVDLHGSAVLHLQLHPDPRRARQRSFWTGRNPSAPRINLSRLKPADRQAALEAIHARLAQERALAGLGEAPSVRQAREAAAFEQRLSALTPVPWALYLVMALNIGVWLLNLQSGLSAVSPTPGQLFAWGANSAWAVTQEGQYWRLFSATFLHSGWLHIALNMYALWASGRQVCRWFGNAQFLLVYLGSALAGSALSLHFSSQQAVSVGASGAVFGVLGAVLVVAWRHRERIASLKSKNLLTSQGAFILYALVQGFGKQGIDNAAHLGGLLAGALMAWLLIEQVSEAATGGQRRQRQALVATLAAAAVVALVLTTPTPRINHRQLFATQAAMLRVLPQMQAAEKALEQDAQASRGGQISAAQLVEAMAQRHIPAYRAVGEALAPLSLPASDPMQPWLADLKQANRVFTQMMQLEVQKAQGVPDPEAIDRQVAGLVAELQVVQRRMNDFMAQRKAPEKR